MVGTEPKHKPPETIFVKLNQIVMHPDYQKYSEVIAMTDYLLDSYSDFTPLTVKVCMMAHPVVVTNSMESNGNYTCVAGARTLNLAIANLAGTKKIPVLSLGNLHDMNAHSLVAVDILASHLLYSLRKPEAVGGIFTKLSASGINLKEILIGKACTRMGIPVTLKIPYKKLFPQGKPDHEGNI